MTRKNCSITLTAAIASLITLAPQMMAGTPGSVSIAQGAQQTLKEMKLTAAMAAEKAEQIDFYSVENKASPDAYLTPLNALRDDVNTMGKQIASLEAQRDSLRPWEQKAVDKVLPLMRDAAANAQNTIHYFNENHLHLWSPDYQKLATSVERDSRQIASTINTYLKDENAREAAAPSHSIIGRGSN